MSDAGNSGAVCLGSMEGRSSMAEMPVFLKTGVPLVLSVAGLICAGFITRRRMVKEGSESDIEENAMEDSSTFVLESARAEFSDREDDSSMVEEKKSFEVLVLEGLKVVEQLGFVKLENGMLRRKVRKFLRKANRQSVGIREKDYMIEAAREEIRRFRGELEERTNEIEEKEDEARELQAVIYSLQEVKDELQVKLNSAEIESGRTRMEEYKYDELVDELEQLREERAAEVTEKISLRWTNACLRYELVRIQIELQRQMDNMGNHLETENEAEGSPSDDHIDPNLSKEAICNSRFVPKRMQFLRKIRRWVEGGSGSKTKMELGEKLEGARKSVGGVPEFAEEGEERLPPVTRFCSGA